MRKEYDFSNGKRGSVLKSTGAKTRITIRIDDDVLEWFHTRVDEAGGGNYQTMINEALRAFMSREQESLETVIRRVVREELKKAVPPRQKAVPPRQRKSTKAA
jgi:BrnA antitoxin of type II toxin-antitoxin system